MSKHLICFAVNFSGQLKGGLGHRAGRKKSPEVYSLKTHIDVHI